MVYDFIEFNACVFTAKDLLEVWCFNESCIISRGRIYSRLCAYYMFLVAIVLVYKTRVGVSFCWDTVGYRIYRIFSDIRV